MFILGFYIKSQLYAFKVVQETLQNKLFGKIKSNKHCNSAISDNLRHEKRGL